LWLHVCHGVHACSRLHASCIGLGFILVLFCIVTSSGQPHVACEHCQQQARTTAGWRPQLKRAMRLLAHLACYLCVVVRGTCHRYLKAKSMLKLKASRPPASPRTLPHPDRRLHASPAVQNLRVRSRGGAHLHSLPHLRSSSHPPHQGQARGQARSDSAAEMAPPVCSAQLLSMYAGAAQVMSTARHGCHGGCAYRMRVTEPAEHVMHGPAVQADCGLTCLPACCCT